jgi:hypothetical protein
VARSHDAAWRRLGSAGTWLAAEERIALLVEARRAHECELCRRRKAALSPNMVEGAHVGNAALSAAEVDAVHRITTDPGRLTQAWFTKLAIPPERYVELLCVAAHAIAIDTFHRAVGLPGREPPPSTGGEPTQRRPAGRLDTKLAWVPIQRLRAVPNLIRSISLVPDELLAVREVTAAEYVRTDRVTDLTSDPGRAITRAQMEHVAARVSARNGCFY